MRVLSNVAIMPSASAHLHAPWAPILGCAGLHGLGPGRTSPALGDNGMSQPSRPRASGPAQRRRRDYVLEQPVPLEDRRLPAPVMSLFQPTVTFIPTTPSPTNSDLGTVIVGLGTSIPASGTAAPITSVAELTPNASFGGDIVNIAPGPGGVFGSDVYAISRGAGGNTSAINRPGVIYRVNP